MIDYKPIIKNKKPISSAVFKEPKIDFLLVRTANQCLADAEKMPIPKMLCSELWHEGELAILFADTNVGKTALAVQIADLTSSGSSYQYGFRNEAPMLKTLYLDFEMSDKQFQKRNSNNYVNNRIFSEYFFRAVIVPDLVDFEGDFEKELFQQIENQIVLNEIRVLIVDNITYLRNQATDTSKEALPLMRVLNNLKKQLNVSILALAHTPKRDESTPITLNHLAGSKQLSNFADAIFAVSRSHQEPDLRYIKQLKARNSSLLYDGSNAIICRIKQPDNFLYFDIEGYGSEHEHLRKKQENGVELEQAIAEMKNENPSLSLREIAEQLGTNQMKVKRTLEKHELV
jgi:AAA domain